MSYEPSDKFRNMTVKEVIDTIVEEKRSSDKAAIRELVDALSKALSNGQFAGEDATAVWSQGYNLLKKYKDA